MLIHWPVTNNTNSDTAQDMTCNTSPNNTQYNPSLCRQNTWKAYSEKFSSGALKAIGVT